MVQGKNDWGKLASRFGQKPTDDTGRLVSRCTPLVSGAKSLFSPNYYLACSSSSKHPLTVERKERKKGFASEARERLLALVFFI